MAHAYHELKEMTVGEPRELAKSIRHDAVLGWSQMNKDRLLSGICLARRRVRLVMMKYSKRLPAGVPAAAFVLLCGCAFNPVQAGHKPPPEVVLFEGNDATQDALCTLPVPTKDTDAFIHNFKDNHLCKNDEARSLVLHNVRAGLRVTLFDDPDCTRSDSTTEIVVLRNLETKTVGSFEREVIDNDIQIHRLVGGNLDGKVSCILLGR
jgi:hypothetical protein